MSAHTAPDDAPGDASLSRNDAFYQSTATAPPPPRPRPPSQTRSAGQLARAPSQPRRRTSQQHTKKPSFGHISDTERQRICADRQLEIRLYVNERFKLGEGRNARVYLSAYRWPDGSDAETGGWRLCATKRFECDHESQTAGLEEVYALRRLGPHPHIVRLIGVLDEVGIPSNVPLNRASTGQSAPDLLSPHMSGLHLDRATEIANPSRILMLMEYMPYSLDEFVRRNPRAVTLAQWIAWARQIASAVQWLHSRGCVHGDMKKQNVLLDHSLNAKLCDFTSVLFRNAPVPATDCFSLGTPTFRAPELYQYNHWHPPEGGDGEGHPALSFTLDIFSLGVLLYSLASGVEPSELASSVLAIRQRQFDFFRSEENDRVERMSVRMGSATPEDRAASRHRRSDSNSSNASGSSSTSQQDAWFAEVTAPLLDPSPEPQGILATPRNRDKVMLRTQSLRENPRQDPSSRAALNRALSLSISPARTSQNPRYPPRLLSGEVVRHQLSDRGGSAHSPVARGSRGSPLAAPAHDTPHKSPSDESIDAENDVRPYEDGMPALILPGGGRLPDKLRDLINQMVDPNPEERPSAAEVVEALAAHSVPDSPSV